MLTAGVTDDETIIVTALDAAEAGLAQDSEDVIIHVITSPLFREELE
ncbi:hypothetical protein SDC9_165339 [bioreactor metagenome]|uniref:Uncharacterized protein n=1 Tax=bioreactor metagenome TaxID=1076179 RepID=A0A645FU25_9ZZZZ